METFSRNFGKEAAIYAGFQKATGDFITVIDADLQQRPETVARMVKILQDNEEFDCVAAYQEKRQEGKLVSKLKDMFYKIINRTSEIEFFPGASDFRTFRRPVVDAVLSLPEYHRFSGLDSIPAIFHILRKSVMQEKPNGPSINYSDMQ